MNFHFTRAGTVTFGTLDSTQYSGSISYTPVYIPYGSSFWGINITSYSVGASAPITLAMGPILDTGSFDSLFPASVTTAYYANVAGAELYSGQWIFPCSATLPDFHVKVSGGYNVTIHGPFLNLGSVGSNYCYGGLQPTTGLPSIGIALYQSLFVVFDYGEERVGFATKPLS